MENEPKNDKEKEKQEKIDEIFSEIMEMINRNTESLLKEKKLEEELSKIISTSKKI